MPKIDLATVPAYAAADSAEAVGGPLGRYEGRAVGEAGGLTQFGVNVETLRPGSASSHRHWHEAEDEFVIVLSGRLDLEEDAGTTRLGAGDMAAFPAGRADGHRLVNASAADATFLVVGTRAASERCVYSDLDLVLNRDGGRRWLTRRDGTPIDMPQNGDGR